MANITYYIGAGASCNSLPLVRDMKERMEQFKDYINYMSQNGTLNHDFTKTYLEELDKIIQAVYHYGTIDTYARNLYINGTKSMDLVRLKAILGGYILYEQSSKDEGFIRHIKKKQPDFDRNLDPRYNFFMANHISSENKSINDNIKIISWNYDSQFELAYSNNLGKDIDYSMDLLKIYPSPYNHREEDISIIKLNGTAGLIKESQTISSGLLFSLKTYPAESLRLIIDLLKFNYHRVHAPHLLYFGWE